MDGEQAVFGEIVHARKLCGRRIRKPPRERLLGCWLYAAPSAAGGRSAVPATLANQSGGGNRQTAAAGSHWHQHGVSQGNGRGQGFPHLQRRARKVAARPGFLGDVGTQQVGGQMHYQGVQGLQVVAQRFAVQRAERAQDGQAGGGGQKLPSPLRE